MEKELKQQFEYVCYAYIKAFLTKHDLSSADWIGSGVGEVVCINGEIFLNFDDVRYDIDHTADHDPNEIWRWRQYCQRLDYLELPKRINFSSWCKGAPHPYSDKQLEELDKLHEAVLEAKKRFDETKENPSF